MFFDCGWFAFDVESKFESFALLFLLVFGELFGGCFVVFHNGIYMRHNQIQSKKAHYAIGANSMRTHILVQLGEDIDESPGHVQIRLQLTAREVDDMINLLQRARLEVSDGR